MELILGNSQDANSPLEIGVHVLGFVDESIGGRGHEGGLSAYSRQGFTKDEHSVNDNKEDLVNQEFTRVNWTERHFRALLKHLSAIHAAPKVRAALMNK